MPLPVAAGIAGISLLGGLFGHDGPDRVPDRNLNEELTTTLDSLRGVAPGRYQATSEYLPKYTGLETGRDTQVRTSGIADVGMLAPQIVQIQRSANPAAYALIDSLMKSAQERLNAGGALSPDEQRMVNQRSRAAFSARGLGAGAVAAGTELLDEERYRRERLDQDRQFATSVAGLGVGATPNVFAPVLGQPTAGYGRQVDTMFDPQSPYAADLYNTNLNKNASQANAAANNRAAIYGAGINAIGSVLDSYYGG